MTTAEASAPPPLPPNSEEAAAAADCAKEQQQQDQAADAAIDELDELIDFLGDGHRPEVRLEACRLVEGLTGDAAGRERLGAAAATLLPPLLRRATEEEEEEEEGEGGSITSSSSSRPALAALVNLSQDPGVARAMLDLGAVQRAMDCLREQKGRGGNYSPSSASASAPSVTSTSLAISSLTLQPPPPSRPDMLLMLLSNLTALEEGAALLLQLGRAKVEGFNLAVLLHRFLSGGDGGGGDAEAEGIASLLANATALPDGRRLLVGPSGAFGAVAQAAFGGGAGIGSDSGSGESSPRPLSLSAAARRASAAALRNCCLAASRDGTIGEIAREERALSAMLRALCGEKRAKAEEEAGGEGDGKQKKAALQEAAAAARSGAAAWAGTNGLSTGLSADDSTKDPDPGVRAALAEAVLVLADDEEVGRPLLWRLDAPELLRQGYEDEEDAATCEALERTAEIFLAGAGGVDEIGDGGGDDEEGEEEKKEEKKKEGETEDERRRRGRTGMMRA